MFVLCTLLPPQLSTSLSLSRVRTSVPRHSPVSCYTVFNRWWSWHTRLVRSAQISGVPDSLLGWFLCPLSLPDDTDTIYKTYFLLVEVEFLLLSPRFRVENWHSPSRVVNWYVKVSILIQIKKYYFERNGKKKQSQKRKNIQVSNNSLLLLLQWFSKWILDHFQ